MRTILALAAIAFLAGCAGRLTETIRNLKGGTTEVVETPNGVGGEDTTIVETPPDLEDGNGIAHGSCLVRAKHFHGLVAVPCDEITRAIAP